MPTPRRTFAVISFLRIRRFSTDPPWSPVAIAAEESSSLFENFIEIVSKEFEVGLAWVANEN